MVCLIVGPALGDPRLAMTGVFLSLSRILPDAYPLKRDVLKEENAFGRMLDYGIIQPRLQQLYEWSAEELQAPGLLDLVRGGLPVYAWPAQGGDVWEPAAPSRTIRLVRRVFPTP